MCRKLTYLVSFVLVLVLVSDVSAGLVAHWEFDDGAGTIARDSSGNGHDGTLQGDPQWVAGMIGSGALSFDGSDGLVDVGHDESLSITDELTITVWLKVGDLSTYYFLVCKQPSGTAGDNYPGNYEFRTEINTGALQFGHQQAEGEQYIFYTSETSITAEQWYHVAVSVTKGELVEFYIDGVSAGSAEQLTNFGVLNDEPVRIGGRKDGYSFFNGILDDIRLYDRALSAVQIQKLYNGNPPTFTIAEKPDPADGTLHSDTWVNMSWQAGDYAVSHDVYFTENFDDVNAGAESTFQGNQVGTFFVVGFPGFPYPDGLVPGTTYYWRIDEVNDADPNSPWKGDVWSFGIPPKTAYYPGPADGAELVATDVKLSWTGGFGAKLHTVYFGDNFDNVNNATGGLPQGTMTYNPGPLKSGKTYYWRVDEFDIIDT
ncbi:MAG: LamG domain-containing protein, partial [Sedimentisphaerales bacterium]